MYSLKNKTLKSNRKYFLVSTAVICLLAIGALAFVKFHKPTTSSSSSATINGINLNPPSASDKAEADNTKNDLAKSIDQQTKDQNNTSTTTAPPAGQKKTAQIVISSSSQANDTVRIAAYVSNVFEENGICDLALTNGVTTITRETSGFQNASYTQCKPFTIPRSEFPVTGTWNAKVTYNSSTTSGESSITPIEIK